MSHEVVAEGAYDEPTDETPVIEIAAEGALEEVSDAASD